MNDDTAMMNLEKAERLVGRRPTRELRNMILALSMHTWMNTAEDNERLAAAKLMVAHRRKRASSSACAATASLL